MTDQDDAKPADAEHPNAAVGAFCSAISGAFVGLSVWIVIAWLAEAGT